MKILVSYPWLDLGGAPNTTMSLVKGLRELGHEVVFFTRKGGVYEDSLRDLEVPVVYADYDRFLPHLYHLHPAALRLFKDTIDRYGIEVVHCFHRNSYFLAQFAALTRNIPVVFTSVWFLDAKVFPVYPGRLIFVAEEFRDDALSRIRGKPRELAVIPNRVDLDRFHPGIDHSVWSSKKGLPEEGWKIAFMSRIDHTKYGSVNYAAEAAGILAGRGRDITLAIAGDGTRLDDLRALAGRINSTAGREVVKILGTVIETPEFLSWSDLVLGVGRCVWEGMACAKPAIVVGEKGMAGTASPDVVETLKYYNFAGRNITTPNSPEVLAESIEKIMDDSDRYASLSSFSREYVLENYDCRAGAARLEEIYRKALSDPLLSAGDKARLLADNIMYGYGNRLKVALRIKLRNLAGRGRPEDAIRG